ncbi:MAG: YbaY family lipoprotein [Cyanobacteria bacterium J06650_10]
MANFKGIGFPLLGSSTFDAKQSAIFPVASALLAVTFSAMPFSHRAATAQASADERTIVMCETSSAAVRIYEKEGEVLMRAFSRTQNSLWLNNMPIEMQSLAESTEYRNPLGEMITTVNANAATDDCTIQISDQPAESGNILERGAPPAVAEGVEPENTGSETAETTVTGSVLYQARIALPPEAVVEVKLLDVSLADAPAVTVAEQTIVTTGQQVPIPFSLPYSASDIDISATYIVSADILVDDQLRWTTDTQYPVLTQGAPSEIDVVLVMADGAGTPDEPPVEPTEPEPTEPEPTTPEPTEPEPITPEPTMPEAALPNEVEIAVKAALAAEIGDTVTTVDSYSQQTWSDGCLGLGGPAESCLAALTEGWQVELVDSATGDRYTYRTNEDGSAVRLDENANLEPSN